MYGSGCGRMQNPKHMNRHRHSFLEGACSFEKVECRYGIKCERILVVQHMAQINHPWMEDRKKVCPRGAICHETDPGHYSAFAHPCRQWFGCTDHREDHRTKYVHPCDQSGQCQDGSQRHRRNYDHRGVIPSGVPSQL